jgi:hypothetical protein
MREPANLAETLEQEEDADGDPKSREAGALSIDRHVYFRADYVA